MKLRIVTVSHRAAQWIKQGYEEYARRMPKGMTLDLVEVRPEVRGAHSSDKEAARVKEAEAQRLRQHLGGYDTVIALDERGKAISTRDLADLMAGWQRDGRHAAFVIGGADGLDEGFKREVGMRMSLSAMTLPHQLVRVLLAEQLYRAASILGNHPYHRA